MPSARPAPAGAAEGTAAGALSCDLPDFTASTSDFTTRPCGPLPAIADTSMLDSFARRRASGEAKTRTPLAGLVAGVKVKAPSPLASLGPLPPGRGVAAAAPCPTSPFGGEVGAAAPGEGALAAGAGAGAFASAALSPSVRSTAMTALTFTLSVPSGTTILPILPSSTASTSMVALSVSISAITSPEETLSPSLTCHLASLPSSILGESAVMVMLMLMAASPADVFVPDFRIVLDELCHHVFALGVVVVPQVDARETHHVLEALEVL